ncbi:MAG: response regulator [Calditrichaeota bacterium]|nr:response regulator [Calditrichota bacterium]
MKILLIEDEKLLLWSLKRSLTREGFEVIAEDSGEKAFAWLSKYTFDWVITDFRLPGLNGLEVLREVKQCQPNVKTMLISAFGSPELRKSMEADGILCFLPKPFNIDELIKILRETSFHKIKKDRFFSPLLFIFN